MEKEKLSKFSIDKLTHEFVDAIKDQTIELVEGIEYLIDEDYENFKENLNNVIKTSKEIKIKKTFETKLWKSKLIFSKKDRLKVFSKINDMKNIGEFMAHKMQLYKVVFPDKEFKLQIRSIIKSLRLITNDLTEAIKHISDDLTKARAKSEEVKEERRKMRREEFALLERLWNYDMDYISRTFLYLKELIENIMKLADHIKDFAEYIQFLATKYLIFE
ncbi:MAG: hypothetical protein R6U96_17650 [Promethearchaeia archaeon]